MSNVTSALNDLILKFDIPLPDDQFPELVASLGEEARKRAAARDKSQFNPTYFYLLARTYELLGYCARHTPWLSHSQRFYWQTAVGFLDEAIRATPEGSPQHSFLRGKFLLRCGMIHTSESRFSRTLDASLALLTAAEAAFKDAAKDAEDRNLQLIYDDASFIARTEALQRIRVADVRRRIEGAAEIGWMSAVNQVMSIASASPAYSFLDLPSKRSGMYWRAQHALAEARDLNAQARLLEEIVGFLRSVPKNYSEAVKSFIDSTNTNILACYEASAKLCHEAGLTIRAAHTRVMRFRLHADAELRKCIGKFKSSDAARRNEFLERSTPGFQSLPSLVVPLLANTKPHHGRQRAADALVDVLRHEDVDLGEVVMVFSDESDSWIISDGFARYHVTLKDGAARLMDLTSRPICFSHKEALLFSNYADAIETTCRLYADAIREIKRALQDAVALYKHMTAQLDIDQAAINDAHLTALHLTTDAILKELDSMHYPLLSTLRDRICYAWSLLEMFQMRNGSVRLDTLFSAQCRLIMANPSFVAGVDDPQDNILEVGADPIFRMNGRFCISRC